MDAKPPYDVSLTELTTTIEKRSPTIKSLNFSHEAIARWLLENPGAKQGECAKAFGYSQAWLSIIIHSDAFQAKLQAMQADADAAVINDIPAKMRGIAAMALDGVAAQVELALEDPSILHRKYLHDTADMVLTKLGYGSAQRGGVVNIVNAPGAQTTIVDASALARAREKMLSPPTTAQAQQLMAPSEQAVASAATSTLTINPEVEVVDSKPPAA